MVAKKQGENFSKEKEIRLEKEKKKNEELY